MDDDAAQALAYLLEQEHEQTEEDEMQSENINELAAALAIAQGQITGALKGETNSFFNSKYADLASVWDACRKSLSEQGLAVIQTTDVVTEGSITLVTTLAHKSGQFVRGVMTMSPKDKTPQAFGSCLTYMRRYGLAAIVGVAQVDDDANAATGKATEHKTNGDRSGRPDTGHVDPKRATDYGRAMYDAVSKSDAGAARHLHDVLNTDDALYTAANDEYKSICKAMKLPYGGQKWTDLIRADA
jgi:hypothetical protein